MRRGVNLSKTIVLTYDDCPRSISDFKSAINYALTHDIGLALFPTGDCVRSYKRRGLDLVNYARQRGIWVGNHSVSHPDLNLLSRAAIAREIGGTVKSDVGRPPYGAINTKVRGVYDKLGIRPWTWTVDTNDWRGKTRSQVVAWTVKYARAGDTVLMHMQWRGFNPTAMRDIKRGLAAKGRHLCGIWRGSDRFGLVEETTAAFPDNIC
jgi:peptidoglycan/xylan/chitin deacetylase (PgdA/CDA1 family)